jgi:Peptidase family M23
MARLTRVKLTIWSLCSLLIYPVFLLCMVIANGKDQLWMIAWMAIFCAYIVFGYFVFPWATISIYLRTCWFIGLFVMLVMLVYFYFWFIALLILAATFLADLLLRRGFSKESLSIQAFSSLRLCVLQGGNAQLLNHHRKHPAQRYALDLVGIGTCGRRAKGLYPSVREAYVCFGASIHSPLSGIVLKVEDGHSDLTIGERDTQQPYGNFIMLQPTEHKDKQIVLAHLMNQSIIVKAGDSVRYGDMIGRIGNSGNSTEPHLHIHAQKVDNGIIKGIPIQIEGHRFIRNSVLNTYTAPDICDAQTNL